MSALDKINGKTKPFQRRRFDKRPDEFITDDERLKARRTALKRLLAKRDTSNIEDRKEPKS